MGVGGSKKAKSESIKPLYNKEEGFQLSCSECILIPKILKIDYMNYSIEYECPKHGYKEENIKEYFESAKKYLYKNNQNNSENNNNDEEKKQIFYYCLQCKKFLCKQCNDNDKHNEFIKINDPENKSDIHLNNYCKCCVCNKQLYYDKQINCKNEEKNIKNDLKLIQKLKDKREKLKEKRDYRKCVSKLMDKLINIYEKQDLNHLNNNNIIIASKNIEEKKNQRLLTKFDMLKEKMLNYLKLKLSINFDDNGIELKINGRHVCDVDLLLLNKINKNFDNIVYLNLENNDINNLEILNKFYLPNLKDANFKDNKIESILNLKDVFEVNKKLETLNVSHNLIQKGKVNPNEINENIFQYVKEINLEGNDDIRNEIKQIKQILVLNQKIRNGVGCTLKYKIEDKNKEIRIFGSEFVSNNKDKCEIYINGNEIKLLENYKVEEGEINDNFLYVKLIFKEDIDDISCIFDGCQSLISISDISNWNISKVTKMNKLFNECISLKSLPDISGWDTCNVTTMEKLFNQCESLESLPDIGQWDTSNVIHMKYLFCHCNTLEFLPKIGKWNLSNVKTMFKMFGFCQSLSSLPDISRFNISNVTDISYLFEGCSSLKSLPDISKWDTSKVEDMAGMFVDCQLLEKLPDISKWNTSEVTDMDNMFRGCKNLKDIPDFSKWNINKVEDMNNMFNGCSLIKSFSVLSNWDLSNVKAEGMFEGCENGMI